MYYWYCLYFILSIYWWGLNWVEKKKKKIEGEKRNVFFNFFFFLQLFEVVESSPSFVSSVDYVKICWIYWVCWMLCRLLRGRKKEEKQVEESSSFQFLLFFFSILNSGLVTNLCISLPRGETFPTDLFALLFLILYFNFFVLFRFTNNSI